MQALLAYRRVNPEVPLGFDVGFEIRSMTCFNGFNTQNAFRTVTPAVSGELKLILPGGDHRQAIYSPDRSNDIQGRPWEFIALGWLNEIVTKKSTFATFIEQRTSLRGIEWACSILNREHILGRYEDWYLSQMVTGVRDRTPNEVFLGNILRTLGDTASDSWAEGFETNPMAWAIQSHGEFQCILYDFVGSERPSGLAVAYLQVYRNVARTLAFTTGDESGTISRMVQTCMGFDRNLTQNTFKSFVPVMSAFINNGSDSDIFSFATAPALPLQIMKFGTFSIGDFMDNSVSMSVEGNYVKGHQSSGLATKIIDATVRSGQTVGDCGFSGLGNVTRVMATFASFAQPTRLTSYGAKAFIEGIQSQFAAIRQLPDMSTLPARVREAMRTFVDLRTPVVPQTRTAGAASGFLQWAEQSAASVNTIQ